MARRCLLLFFFLPIVATNGQFEFQCDESVNRCYSISPQLLNYTQALDYCSGLEGNTRLAEIRSSGETASLIALFPEPTWAWIGINDYDEEGRWVYSTSGDQVQDYSNWNLNWGEPDGGRTENFVIAHVKSGWSWMDYKEEMRHSALCERIGE